MICCGTNNSYHKIQKILTSICKLLTKILTHNAVYKTARRGIQGQQKLADALKNVGPKGRRITQR